MAKQNINVGTTANDKKGDSLRAAFQKVNANFTELYTALGLNADTTLNLGAFEFNGSVMSTTDSTAIVIDQSVTVSSDLTVGGDIVPSIANGGNLGSLTRPFRSLFVSNNTVFLGGVPLSLDPGTNELQINNVPISQTITYADIPNSPTVPIDISDLTDTEGLLGGGGGDTGDITFENNTIVAAADTNFYIESKDEDDVVRAYFRLDPGNGRAEMRALSSYRSASFSSGSWTTAVWTGTGGEGQLAFTGATELQTFLNNDLLGAAAITISINYGEYVALNSWSGGGGDITVSVNVSPPTDPTTVTNIEFRYHRQSRIEIDSDDDEITIYGDGLDIKLNSTAGIDIRADNSVELQSNTIVSLLNNSTTNPIIIRTNNGNTNQTWEFSAAGRTTFPTSTAPAYSYGAAGDIAGMVAFDSSYIYYCTSNYVNNSTNIWKRVALDATSW
jgi:hypothetical protein